MRDYATPIIGRARELGEIDRAIRDGARLISLHGLGGIGKTRLASAFSAGFEGEAVFVDLASARTAADVCLLVARTLDLRTDEGSGDALVLRIREILARRGRTLIVLDNFEQLDAPAGDVVARWLTGKAVFLVTTRRPLGIEGELVLSIAPLALPGDHVSAEESDAVKLFLARAAGRAHGATDLGTVAEIVVCLDGIPLAIELAAARLDVLPLASIAERLSQRFALLRNPMASGERHGTLHRALEWSWELLEPWQQAAFAQASVFAGSFGIEDAEAVMRLSGEASALDAVHALVRQSLALVQDERFALLDTVREWAAGKLAGEREAAYLRHAAHYIERGFANAIAIDARGLEAALSELERDAEELAAALRRAVAARDGPMAVRALVALLPVLARRMPADERLRAIDQVLALQPDLRVETARAAALRQLGRTADALLAIEHGLRQARDTSSPAIEAMLLDEASATESARGHPEAARRYAQQAIAICRSHRIVRGEGLAHIRHAIADSDLADFDCGMEHGARALEILGAIGDRQGEIRAHVSLGMCAFERGDLPTTQGHMEKAARLADAVNDRMSEAVAYGYLGGIAHEREDWQTARARYESARDAFARIAERRLEAIYIGYVGIVTSQSGDVSAGLPAIERARALLEEIGDARHTAAMMGALVSIRALMGELAGARAMLADLVRIAPQDNKNLEDAARVYEAVIDAMDDGRVSVARERLRALEHAPIEEARLALPFLRRALGVTHERARTWVFDDRGIAFAAPGSSVVRLDTRGPLSRILALLVRHRVAAPGAALDRDRLVAAGWPEEPKLPPASASNRLKVAVSALRKAGLERVLLTAANGYLLDAGVPIRLADLTAQGPL